MRNKVLTALCALAFVLPVPVRAQEAQPGDACTNIHRFKHVGGPENPGAGYLLVCDGSTWQRVTEWDTSTANLGVKQAAPKAPLHVGGEAIIGVTTGLACDADRKGGLRWSDAESTIEMCDGANWRKIAATAAATDCTPDAFSFIDLTGQSLNALILSDTVNITGIDPGCTVSVTGSGSPEISVNGGAWVGASPIDPGDSLQVRMISSGDVSTERIAAVTVGDTTDNWSVTTKAGQTRIFAAPSLIGGGIGGLAQADTHCQNRAGELGYGGTWKALLSDETTNAKDRVTITYPVVRAADSTVVDNSNIWDGNLQAQIHTTQFSEEWTGSDSTGNKIAGKTCSSWTSTGASGQYGNADGVGSDWFSLNSTSCGNSRLIFCVDQ